MEYPIKETTKKETLLSHEIGGLNHEAGLVSSKLDMAHLPTTSSWVLQGLVRWWLKFSGNLRDCSTQDQTTFRRQSKFGQPSDSTCWCSVWNDKLWVLRMNRIRAFPEATPNRMEGVSPGHSISQGPCRDRTKLFFGAMVQLEWFPERGPVSRTRATG